jgi:hypothetical protein
LLQNKLTEQAFHCEKMAEPNPGEEGLELLEEKQENWNLTVHVHGKRYNVSCGDASQRIKWLAHVGIARWDENTQQGWRKLGVPTKVTAHRKDGVEMDMGHIIRDHLQNGDTIFVQTSLQPSETTV